MNLSLWTNKAVTMDWHIVYAKFDGCKGFKAFDVNEGRQVGNLIYASLMENTEDTRQKLQKLADLNKEYHLVKGNGQTNHLPTILYNYG